MKSPNVRSNMLLSNFTRLMIVVISSKKISPLSIIISSTFSRFIRWRNASFIIQLYIGPVETILIFNCSKKVHQHHRRNLSKIKMVNEIVNSSIVTKRRLSLMSHSILSKISNRIGLWCEVRLKTFENSSAKIHFLTNLLLLSTGTTSRNKVKLP